MNKFNKKFNVKISGDFEDDPLGALDALDKTDVAVFFISKAWFDDPRAQNEWRHVKDLGKPMIYIFDKTKKYDVENKFLLNVPNLCGTVNYYGDMKKMTLILKAIISSAIKAQKIQ